VDKIQAFREQISTLRELTLAEGLAWRKHSESVYVLPSQVTEEIAGTIKQSASQATIQAIGPRSHRSYRFTLNVEKSTPLELLSRDTPELQTELESLFTTVSDSFGDESVDTLQKFIDGLQIDIQRRE